MEPAPTPPATPAPPPRHRPPWLTSFALVLVPAAALVAAGWLTLAWLNATTAGLRTLLWAAAWGVPSLSASSVEGSLRDGFTIGRLAINEPRWGMDASEVNIRPEHIGWASRSLDLANVSARRVTVTWTPSETKTPNEPPASLALPIALRLRNVAIAELQIGERGQPPQVLSDVRLQGQTDGEAIRIEQASARYGATEAVLRGTLGAARPFPLAAHAELRSVVLDQPVQANADATGSLLDMRVTARSDNDAGRFDGIAHLTPFADVPLAALSLTIADLRPEQWVPSLPAMRLAGSAELAPQPGGTFTLAGPFRVTNASAGPVDRGQVPVQSARGSLRWSAAALDLTIEQVEGAGGTARANVLRSADGAVTAKISFNAIDASRIQTTLTPTQASGQLEYELDKGRQRFTGRASNARGLPLNVDFTMALADNVLDIQRATARIGEGRADVSGRVQLGRETVARLRGEFNALDLGQFVRGMDARVNGRIDVDATLQPVRRGRADVTLTDSRLYGRSIEGHANVRLDGDQFDVDTDLKSGTARLQAKGGLGNGRELAFDLSAPRLGDLMPALGGSITAQGTIGGSMKAPTLAATASAAALVLPGEQRIEKLEAAVRGGLAPDAPLDVNATLAGHSMPNRPELSLATASLTVRGTTGAHAIELDGATGAQQPLSLRAKGGWQQDAWRGSVGSLVAGKPFDLRLETATPVTLGKERVAVGPTRVVARDTRLEDVEFTRVDGRWRSVGTFSHLQPQAFDPRIRTPRRAVRTTGADPQPLTLAGRWSLEYSEAISGIVIIERTGGDLYGGVDAVQLAR